MCQNVLHSMSRAVENSHKRKVKKKLSQLLFIGIPTHYQLFCGTRTCKDGTEKKPTGVKTFPSLFNPNSSAMSRLLLGCAKKYDQFR